METIILSITILCSSAFPQGIYANTQLLKAKQRDLYQEGVEDILGTGGDIK